jgi:hypothetical protein
MPFHNWDVEADESFTPESDPALRKLIQREAGAAVLQDINLKTYWANTVGKTKYPGTYHLYKEEMAANMGQLMVTRMTYREIEEFMVVLGYETGDIRECFTSMTGVDPVKMEYMRHEDVKATPANIPAYTLAWGRSKKGDSAYFVMPAAGVISVFHQLDDMTRKECASFLSQDDACKHLETLVKRVHRYDLPCSEAVDDHLEPVKEESQKPEYLHMANHFWKQRQSGSLDLYTAEKMVKSAVFYGNITEAEGNDLLDLYVHAAPGDTPNESPEHEGSPKESPDLDYRQDTGDVKDEVERNTPQDFFQSVLPDRMDTVTPQHIKDVLQYVSHREKDMGEFDIKLHSLEYMKHDTPKALVETNPENGRPSGPPRATISVILEIRDKTLPEDHSRKYALAVFFINPDGDIGTSDSVKGEDDIIYGFSEDGLRQYFARDRMVRGQA